MNRTLIVGLLAHALMEQAIRNLGLSEEVVIVDSGDELINLNRFLGAGPDVIHSIHLTDAMPFHERVNQYNSRRTRKGRKK